MKTLLSLKGILLILLFSWHADSELFIQVQTDLGPIHGTTVTYYNTRINLATNSFTTRVNQFLGIPFAKPPIGPLRFKKPEPAENFTGTFVANQMPNACIQFSARPFPWYDNGTHSEDCLYLNIWVPAQQDENLPVMFWIYGGGFTVGSNRQNIYDGRALAAEGGVVVVTINYRMGVFGFLTSGTEEAPGNYGMYDMLEALKWVRRNIAAFGGDPNQVTLVGESAGSIAIGLLCVSPLTEGLFHRVIMESGSPAYTLADNSKNDSIATSQMLAEAVGCATDTVSISNDPERVVSCLRDKDAMFLAEKLNDFHPNSARSFFPIYGDAILPKNARQALIDGDFHNAHVLIGNNADEGAFQLTTGNPELFGFFGEKNPVISKTEAETLLNATFKHFPNPAAVINHYLGNVSADDHVKIRRNVYTAMGDWSLLCPTVFFAESYSRAGNPVHFYFFMHRPDTSPWAKWMGAVHFEEVQFVFGLPLRNATATADEKWLSQLMVRMWASFAKTGFTGVFGGIDWPQYSRENPVYLKLNLTDYNREPSFQDIYGQGPHKEHCDFFRSYFGF